MKEFKVTLTQDLKEQETRLNQCAADGWDVVNIEHTTNYDYYSRTDDGAFKDLYPEDIKTVTTFCREQENDIKV